MKNTFWLVGMPIGNPRDLTGRAREKLEEVPQIWCEDTRSFRLFCQKQGISLDGKKIISFHDHSSSKRKEDFLRGLEKTDLAYVSEAGSPCISDPAYDLLRLCLENEIPIRSCSGVSSVIMALELSGFPGIPFTFHGFLPRQEAGKIKIWQKTAQMGGTHLFFEGVSRVSKTLDEMVAFFPKNTSFMAIREMSKEFETVHRFRGEDWKAEREKIIFKGEFVLGVHLDSGQGQESYSPKLQKILQEIQNKGAKPKILAKLLAELEGKKVQEVYQMYFLSSKGS